MIRVPLSRRSLPGLDDFDQAPSTFDSFERKDVKVEAPGTSIQIKPLPEAGRPASFSGAIGRFTMTTEAQPARTHIGDPVTIKAAIDGLGSFDRMEPPLLVDAAGWKTYQPSSDFVVNDELEISGVRTFTYSAVPVDTVTKTPTVEFSYFDPDTEKYVTLHSPTMLVQVEGRPMPEPSTGGSETALASATPAPKAPLEVLDIQTENTPISSFVPILQQPRFWLLQAVPAALFLTLGAGMWLKNMRTARAPLRALRLERSALRAKLDSSDPRTAYSAAVRLLALDCLIRGKAQPFPPYELIRQRSIPDKLRTQVNEVLARHERLVYGRSAAVPLSSGEQTRLKQLVWQWEHLS
jgi:hypothetical protein